jgi:hypothetical protein
MTLSIQQTPNELQDWTINWATRGLGADTITTSAWAVNSADVALSDAAETATTTTIWVTGGIPGNAYSITNTVETAGGRTLQETVTYVCIPAEDN